MKGESAISSDNSFELGLERTLRFETWPPGEGTCLFTKRDVEGDEKNSSVSIMLRALSGDGDIAG